MGNGKRASLVVTLHRLAWLRLWLEKARSALWMPLCVVGTYIALALLGVPQILPDLWPLNLLLIMLVMVGISIAWFAPLLIAPTRGAATRLLARVLGLQHDPLSVLADHVVSGDASLWAEHRAQAEKLLASVQTGPAFRKLLSLSWSRWTISAASLFLICLAIAGAAAPSRLWAAFFPGSGSHLSPHVTGWAAPPDYMNLPPITLQTGMVNKIPAGSHIFVDLENGGSAGALMANGTHTVFQRLDKSTWQAETTLTRAGAITVRSGFQRVASWQVGIVADQPPRIEWVAPPEAVKPRGARYPKIKLLWHATDDYGIKSLSIEVRLQQKPNLPPLVRALPVSADPKDAKGGAFFDLIANPWAGLPVTMRLMATDGQHQTGSSEVTKVTLPMPQLLNPVAQAVLELRRDLSIDPLDAGILKGKIEALQARPESQAQSPAVAAAFTATFGSLNGASADLTDRAQKSLWNLALKIETDTAQKKKKQRSGKEQTEKELEEIIKREKNLFGRSMSRLQAGASTGDEGDQTADQRQQSGLRYALDKFAQSKGITSDNKDSGIPKASGAMQDAVDALGHGDNRAAAFAQKKALQYLQQDAGGGGGGQGDQEQSAGEQEDPSSHDPLGRPLDAKGQTASDADQSDVKAGSNVSARQIQEELRRRAAERTRPQGELDYINRLLNGVGL